MKIENPDDYLRPDMNASVAFGDVNQAASKLGNPPVALSVPLAAVCKNGEVFVVEGDHVRAGSVAVGTKHNGNAEITSGLEGGEDLVLTPPARLKNGDKIRVKGRR